MDGPTSRPLLGNGQPIALTPKVFDTLVILVRSSGHVVKKDELARLLWPRGFVDDATLSNHIWQIRRALGDTAKTTRFIETVPKLGYRFAAPVTVAPAPVADAPVGETATGSLSPPPALPAALARPTARRWFGRGAVVGLTVALAATASVLFLHWRSDSPGPPHVRTASSRSVALTGFNNLSQVANDAWLASALTTMLATELGATDDIRIVPYELVREALAGVPEPVAGGFPREVLRRLHERLDIDYVISGAYLLGIAADDPPLRLDVVAQDARSGTLLASISNQTGLTGLNLLVNEVTVALRSKLGIRTPNSATSASIAKAPPTMEVARRIGLAVEATQRYDVRRARDELIEVIAQAPGYAPAYLYLATAWWSLGSRQKALAAAEQAAMRAGTLPPEQRLQVDAAVQTARYDWKPAAATWQALVAIKPAAIEYQIAWIDALLAAGEPESAQAAVANLRHMPSAASDPRVTLAAARVADFRSDARLSGSLAIQALKQAQARELPGVSADAEVQLAREQMYLGKFAEADDELTAAIAQYQTLGNPHGEANARRARAAVLGSQHHGQDAREEYQRAMDLAQRIGDQAGIAAVYRDLCEMLWTAGDRDAAEAAARRALQISRETGDLRLQAWTLRALATIASDEADTDEVLERYREVTTLTERSHDAGGHVWSLATNADTLRMRGQLDEAQADCAHARAEAAALSDPQFAVVSGFTCAEVAVDRGEADSARSLLAQVVSLAVASGNDLYAANAELLLGQIDLDASRFAKAAGRLDSARKRFAADGAATGEADAEALLALCAQAAGDSTERDRARARAIALRAAITSKQEIYGVDIAVAQLATGVAQRADAITLLHDIAADAQSRRWLAWALEAELAEWRLMKLQPDIASAKRVGDALETTARQHGFRRVLALMHASTDS